MAFLPKKGKPADEGAPAEGVGAEKAGFFGPTSNAGRIRHRALKIIVIALCTFIAIVGIILFFTEKWLLLTWSDLSPDEILYHLNTPLTGTNTDMIWGYVFPWLIIELVIIAVIAAVLVYLRKNGMLQVAAAVFFAIAAGVLIWLAAADLDEKTGLVSYMANVDEGGPDFVGDHYVDPSDVAITFPEQKRNLIYIYLESMETTYADVESGGAFERNVIPELTGIALQNERFAGDSAQLNGGITLPGTNWTMGAIFGQSSGLPLKTAVNGNAMGGQDGFFSDITALGDILEKEGYRQMFLLGSDAEFGGRELFYSDHGDYEIRDYHYAVENGVIPRGYWVFWGIEDAKLFSMARDSISEMAESSEPFNMTLLTVDTHFEDGYLCDLCADQFGDQYSNVMACSSRQVADFVAWIQQQDFYPNTTIVLTGDHPTMDVDFCDGVPAEYQRKTYTAIINGAAVPEDPARVRLYSTMDLFPTTLAALGVQMEGDRLGLGTNLYSSKDTLLEQLGFESCVNELSKPSSFLEQHANIEIKSDEVEEALRNSESRVEITDGGWVRFVSEAFALVGSEFIDGTNVSIFDKRTGMTKQYPASVNHNPDNFDNYLISAETSYREEDLPYLTAYFYISTKDGKTHHFGTYPGIRPNWLALPALRPEDEAFANAWRQAVFVHLFG